MGAREQRNRGYSRGVRGTLGEKGLRGSDQYFSGRRGAFEGVGRGSHPCSWLVPCEALRFLSFPSEGLCFTCKQWQWPQLAWPSTASKLAEPRKEKEVGVRIGWGRRVGLGGGGYVRMPVLSGHWCHACAHRGRAAEGPSTPFFFFPPAQSLFPGWMNLSEAVGHCVP